MKIPNTILWLRSFRRRFDNRGSEGFSLIEMATIIPVIAITGGFIAMLIAQGIQSTSESAAITSAGAAVSSRATELEAAVNCYQLREMQKTKKTYKQPQGRKDIEVNQAFSGGTCAAGTNVKMTIAGREVGNSRVLYRENIQIFISE